MTNATALADVAAAKHESARVRFEQAVGAAVVMTFTSAAIAGPCMAGDGIARLLAFGIGITSCRAAWICWREYRRLRWSARMVHSLAMRKLMRVHLSNATLESNSRSMRPEKERTQWK